MRRFVSLLLLLLVPCVGWAQTAIKWQVEIHAERPRARALGLAPGVLSPGAWNAITDVSGVEVGHVTLVLGDSVRTGVTAIVPHAGNLYQDKVPAAFHAANAYGKFAGSTQVKELGELETPIILTNTLSVPEAASGLVGWTLSQPGNERVRSVNAVVGETNDGFLNDIRGRYVRPAHVFEALAGAKSGPVEEGAIGAGTGTVAFGWKGGIGTSSRRLPDHLGGFTVGVLVQTNYGGILAMDGVPVGLALDQYYLKSELDRGDADGSVIVIVATDAPLSDRNLERLAKRAMYGVVRTGTPATNGSGDYVLAFSTHPDVRRTRERRSNVTSMLNLPNGLISPLFQAAVEATEEAVYNSLLRAQTTQGFRGTVEAIPVDSVRAILARYGH